MRYYDIMRIMPVLSAFHRSGEWNAHRMVNIIELT